MIARLLPSWLTRKQKTREELRRFDPQFAKRLDEYDAEIRSAALLFWISIAIVVGSLIYIIVVWLATWRGI